LKIQGWKPTFGCGTSTMYPPLKKKPIDSIKSHVIQVETILEIKKLEMQYMDKANGKHFQIV
jgi:hypothetical protein